MIDPTGPDAWFAYTFHYIPNIPSATADAVLFGVVSLVVLLLTMKYGGRYMYIVVFTGALEVVGYVLRIQATHTQDLTLFIVSTLCLLMAPIALAVVNYVVVGKLLAYSNHTVGVGRLQLKPAHIARLFLASDVVTFFIQGGGGGLLALQDKAMNDLGQALCLVGLAIQLAFFAAFTAITVHIDKSPKFGLRQLPNIRPVFTGLYATVGLLFIRNIFRLAEFSSGMTGYVATQEWMFNIFETLPIFMAFIFYAMYHFGYTLGAAGVVQQPAKRVAGDEACQTGNPLCGGASAVRALSPNATTASLPDGSAVAPALAAAGTGQRLQDPVIV